MNGNDFRRLALGMDGAVEGAHMGHPDFRVNGRIFATLDHDETRGMVKLSPEEQAQFMRSEPGNVRPRPPVRGAGRAARSSPSRTVDERRARRGHDARVAGRGQSQRCENTPDATHGRLRNAPRRPSRASTSKLARRAKSR